MAATSHGGYPDDKPKKLRGGINSVPTELIADDRGRSADNSRRFGSDQFLRSRKFRIYSRLDGQHARWFRAGVVFLEKDAIQLAIQEKKCEDRCNQVIQTAG